MYLQAVNSHKNVPPTFIKRSEQEKRKSSLKERILIVFHKYDRPLLIGEIMRESSAISLDETEAVVLEMCHDSEPQIALCSKEELQKIDKAYAFKRVVPKNFKLIST